MSHVKVILGHDARLSVRKTEPLEKQAEALAAKLTMPSGIEFARFEHAGRTYALSAKVFVHVDLLNNRVPDVVIRAHSGGAGPRTRTTRKR